MEWLQAEEDVEKKDEISAAITSGFFQLCVT